MSFLRRGSKGSVSARAQITSYHDGLSLTQREYGASKVTALHTTFQMRVVPDGGQPEFESTMSVWGADADHLRGGRWTYVIYDPDKPEQCDLDKHRLGKEFGRFEGRDRVMIPKDAGDASMDMGDALLKNMVAAAAESASPEPARPPEPDGLVAGLGQLADLHAAGTLSAAEFADAKARLLGHDSA